MILFFVKKWKLSSSALFLLPKIQYHLLMIISPRYLSREENGRREDSLTFWLIPTSIFWEVFSSNKRNDDSDKMFSINFEQSFFVTKLPTHTQRGKIICDYWVKNCTLRQQLNFWSRNSILLKTYQLEVFEFSRQG